MRARDPFSPRLTRLRIATYPLDMRQKHARCALGVRDAPADEYTTNTQRVFHVYLALVQRAPRVAGVRLRASSSTHVFEHAQKLSTHTTHDDECITLAQRANARVTNAQRRTTHWPKMNEFSVRWPCVVYV